MVPPTSSMTTMQIKDNWNIVVLLHGNIFYTSPKLKRKMVANRKLSQGETKECTALLHGNIF